MVRFIHAADIHLGYDQYGLHLRFVDFGRAFLRVVDAALDPPADFFLIAGDLFHKRAINARTLAQAVHGLKRLRDAGVPVLAIEGNHDWAYHGDSMSWLSYLRHEGLLVLLRPEIADDGLTFPPWDPATRTGGMIDLPCGVRVYGLGYLGASASSVIPEVAKAIEPGRFTIVMLHAGVEGVLPHLPGCVPREVLAKLRPSTDYLALGHVHKDYVLDGWAFNPGSPETCSLEEAEFPNRGYIESEVYFDGDGGAVAPPPGFGADHPGEPPPAADPAVPSGREESGPGAQGTVTGPGWSLRFRQVPTERRRFVHWTADLGGRSDPEDAERGLREFVERAASNSGLAIPSGGAPSEGAPVVILDLVGVLGFDRVGFDTARVSEYLRGAIDAVHVEVRNHLLSPGYKVDAGRLDRLDRASLEGRVVAELMGRQRRWAPTAADLVTDLRSRLLSGEPAASLLDYLVQTVPRVVLRRGGEEVGP